MNDRINKEINNPPPLLTTTHTHIHMHTLSDASDVDVIYKFYAHVTHMQF